LNLTSTMPEFNKFHWPCITLNSACMADSLMSMTHLLTVDWHNIQLQLLEGAAPASALFGQSVFQVFQANIVPDMKVCLLNTYILQL